MLLFSILAWKKAALLSNCYSRRWSNVWWDKSNDLPTLIASNKADTIIVMHNTHAFTSASLLYIMMTFFYIFYFFLKTTIGCVCLMERLQNSRICLPMSSSISIFFSFIERLRQNNFFLYNLSKYEGLSLSSRTAFSDDMWLMIFYIWTLKPSRGFLLL